jgi:predicted porin
MKKLLLGSAVVALGFGLAAPASAQVKLDLAGHFKGYAAWVSQDTTPDNAAVAGDQSEEERNLSIVRETEIHFTGETTLDNGLTVGFHAEADVDGNGDTFAQEEAYAYFSGAWGRVNFGREDGAAYLLQVAAPSADSNYDGIRQYVQPINYNIITGAGTATEITFDDIFQNGLAANELVLDVNGNDAVSANDILVGAAIGNLVAAAPVLDYDNAITGTSDKFTYLTPVFNGFQAGFSYTPEIAGSRGLAGNRDDDSVAEYGDVWEVSARYEGQFGELGLAVGAGYSHASLERDVDTVAGGAGSDAIFYRDVNGNGAFTAGTDQVVATLDDQEAWNVGIDLNWGPFGLGAAYTEDDNGVSGDWLETETWVVGADYTTGPFKIGASYYNTDLRDGVVEADRWTGGVTYTYGPGMTFRGSVSFVELDEEVGITNDSADATTVLLGTQIDF